VTTTSTATAYLTGRSLSVQGWVTSGCNDDTERDGVLDAVDNCPLTFNPKQIDTDGDGLGDNCDPDADGDGIVNGMDNCPLVPEPGSKGCGSRRHGRRCDTDGFCLVVAKNPDPAQCLDPQNVFHIVGAPRVMAKTGETIKPVALCQSPGRQRGLQVVRDRPAFGVRRDGE